jgi:HEAT repeat protein
MRSHRPWWAMIFYYTHDVTEELGPTAIMPGSHYYEKFLGERGETLLPTGKAGTMVLVHFDLWHKASMNISNLDRYMLKFQFIRLHAPEKPSWNHIHPDMPKIEGAPAAHLNLWRDIWNWLRGEHAAGTRSKDTTLAQLLQLQSALQSMDAAVRSQTADELGFLGEAAAALAADLGALLDDSEETVALNAAYALGHMGHQGIQVLLGQLASGTSLIATRAAYGLQGGGVMAVPGLVEALHHPDDKRRALAAFALGMIGPAAKESINALIQSIQDESEWVRRNAIESLGMIAQSADQTIPALAKALEDAVDNERAEMDGERGSLYVQNQKYIINKIGYTAALALLRTGKEGDAWIVVRALSKALGSKDRYVRAYASEALTHLRTKEAIDALVQYYRTSRWCADTHKASSF